MRLSVCLIARNEEANIARAIGSVDDVADEVILTDTGSTDDTIHIAKKLGACVELFSWRDDFAAARNHALARAKGDWILWLDADEELLPESVPVLRRCVADDRALAWYVQRQDLVESGDLQRFTLMWQMRLFRNRPELRFIGRCHPHFDPPEDQQAAALGMTALGCDVTLRHHGYFADLKPAKLQRGLRLLQLELADRPGQLYYLLELARGYQLANDPRRDETYAQAAVAVLPHVQESRPPMPQVAMLLEYFLQIPASQLPQGWSPELVTRLAQRWFADSAPLLWIAACQALAGQRFEDAAKMFHRLVTMGERRDYDRATSFDPRVIGEDARLNLAVTLIRLGRLDAARTHLTRLLTSPARGGEARKNLAVIEGIQAQHAPTHRAKVKPLNRKRKR